MQFQVPQFIDMEDKIVGPLTLKQFSYLAVGGLILFILYFLLEFFLWLVIGAVVTLIFLGMAFLKYNGRPFMILAFAIFNYFWQPRFYVWKTAGQINKEAVAGGGLSILGFKINTFANPLSDRKEKPLRPSVLDKFRGTKERFEVFRKATGERDVARRVDYR